MPNVLEYGIDWESNAISCNKENWESIFAQQKQLEKFLSHHAQLSLSIPSLVSLLLNGSHCGKIHPSVATAAKGKKREKRQIEGGHSLHIALLY